MDYKLIATDMDGTLLDEEHNITKENIEAIIKVQKEKGIDKTTKCMIVGKPEEVLIAQEHMNKVHGNDYFITISKLIFLKIANKNVDKGKY